jgi:hypothetical protein
MSDENTAALKNFMDLQDALDRNSNVTDFDDYKARDLIAYGLLRGVAFEANNGVVDWGFVYDEIDGEWLKGFAARMCIAEDGESSIEKKAIVAEHLKTQLDSAANCIAQRYGDEIMEKFSSIDELQEFIYTEI